MAKAIPVICVVMIASVAVVAICLFTHHTAFERSFVSGWRGYAYQIVTAALGCAAFVAIISIMMSSKSQSSLAQLLPLASLPAWMGIFATVCNYRAAYHVLSAAAATPKFQELAVGHVSALSYLLIGLAATIPTFMTIGVALYVRNFRSR